ncbi:MAG: hypothetical protein IPH45_13495 [Bacteroidales bacterium]|nr:hypothetical protein [Bacteroidales bacterium]
MISDLSAPIITSVTSTPEMPTASDGTITVNALGMGSDLFSKLGALPITNFGNFYGS